MKAIEKLQEHPIWLIWMTSSAKEIQHFRAVAEDVTFLCLDQEIILGEKMMQFLHHSQDPVMAENLASVEEWTRLKRYARKR